MEWCPGDDRMKGWSHQPAIASFRFRCAYYASIKIMRACVCGQTRRSGVSRRSPVTKLASRHAGISRENTQVLRVYFYLSSSISLALHANDRSDANAACYRTIVHRCERRREKNDGDLAPRLVRRLGLEQGRLRHQPPAPCLPYRPWIGHRDDDDREPRRRTGPAPAASVTVVPSTTKQPTTAPLRPCPC